MSPINALLADVLLPLEAIKLGRLISNLSVPNFSSHDPTFEDGVVAIEGELPGSSSREPGNSLTTGEPGHDAVPSNTDAATTPSELNKSQSGYDSFTCTYQDQSFASKLTSIMSSKFSKCAETKVRVTSREAKTYLLNDATGWFDAAMRQTKTRKWVENAMRGGRDIYMVIGFSTVVDALLIEYATRSHDHNAKLAFPVSKILQANGIAMAPESIDIDINPSSHAGEGEARRWIADGEQICAVQYGKVPHGLFSGKDLDKLKLVKTKWVRYDRRRGDRKEGDTGDVVMVEVSLDVNTMSGEYDSAMMEEGSFALDMSD